MHAAYIHIPFCRSICTYCDFCKVYYQPTLASKYLKALEEEILSQYNNEVLKTIYIGGGTPSSLSLDHLNYLFIILKVFKKSRNCDYIIAPIADNRMFQIINAFINGELTDEQCKHCLAATNLGMQYIFISEKAANQLKLIERCYIAENEKEYFKNRRYDELKLGDNKVKLAKKQYRGKGLYIDEILK